MAGALVLAPSVLAHIERPAYWPNPRPDKSVSPPAGGRVPHARSLESALKASKPGNTRVVCKPDSLAKAQQSIAAATTRGIRVRPTQKRQLISPPRAKEL